VIPFWLTALADGLVAIGTRRWGSECSNPRYTRASIQVWDPERNTMVEMFGHNGGINSIVEMKNGVLLSLSNDYIGSFRVWDFNAGRSHYVLDYYYNRMQPSMDLLVVDRW